MSVDTFQAYNKTLIYMDRQIDLWGQPCTVYIPQNLAELGYEDQDPEHLVAATGVPDVGTSYKRIETKVFINFHTNISVFYHFNWFPEDKEQLLEAFFYSDTEPIVDAYIRTSIPDKISKWGDMIFKVVTPKEDGMFKVLRRVHFVRPVVSDEVRQLVMKIDAEQVQSETVEPVEEPVESVEEPVGD